MSDRAVDQPRWRAPQRHGEALIQPRIDQVVQTTIPENRALVASLDTFSEIRQQARAQLLQAAVEYTRSYTNHTAAIDPNAPIIMSGHQPELVHCGVWFKNFVLNAVAQGCGGAAINVTIDNDTAKKTSLVVPTGPRNRPIASAVPYDRPAVAVPFEERTIVDHDLFASFAERVSQQIGDRITDPLITQLWPLVLDCGTDNLGQALARGRHQLERELGLQTLEVPLSTICGLPSFTTFLAEIVKRGDEFLDVYNGVLRDYRQANKMKSPSHPVPDLIRTKSACELPFWIWSARFPVRRRLFVETRGSEIELTDMADFRVSAGPQATDLAECFDQCAQKKVRIRPRALTNTLFARLVFSDLFVHGIGGAMYDQITDLIAQRFWNCSLPTYMTATATFRLPIDRPQVTDDDLRQINWQLRDMRFHPEKYVSDADASASDWIQQKHDWIAQQLPRGARMPRHLGIEQANQHLRSLLHQTMEQTAERRSQLQADLRVASILGSREFSFALFPLATLLPQLLELLPDPT